MVADQLQDQVPAGVRVISHGGEPIDLLDLWQGYEDVWLVDASVIGDRAGTISHFAIHDQVLPPTSLDTSSHAFSLIAALELAKTLGRLPNTLMLYTVEGQNFAAPLSAAVQKAVTLLCRQLQKELNDAYLLANPSS